MEYILTYATLNSLKKIHMNIFFIQKNCLPKTFSSSSVLDGNLKVDDVFWEKKRKILTNIERDIKPIITSYNTFDEDCATIFRLCITVLSIRLEICIN